MYSVSVVAALYRVGSHNGADACADAKPPTFASDGHYYRADYHTAGKPNAQAHLVSP
jgi:hypothetical protein|tara:strand:+ start:158 stop:328 length:171 start_codon:yes stop_codon:yes gene_type:complete